MRMTVQAPTTPAAARILAAAATLFYAHGIGAVGVDRIADEAGTTKKTLYDRFGSKEQLVVAYLRGRHARFTQHVHDHLDALPPGRDSTLGVFDALSSWLALNPRGCGFVNAYAELAGTNHAGLAVIGEEKRWVHELFVERLVADGHERGLGAAGVDELARTLAILYEGAIVRTTAGQDPQAAKLARRTAGALLDRRVRAAGPSAPAPDTRIGADHRVVVGPDASRGGAVLSRPARASGRPESAP